MRYVTVLLIFLSFFLFPHLALAIENPLSVSNNKVGIHILFPQELEKAAALVNSSGGDWGYVVIPIQAGDKDLVKWQNFMDQARKFHLIPIIRLASEGDYFNTKVWRKPTNADVLDFANFLNSLSWPIKNRYVIVYNEVNRGNEWGGSPNPKEYADILSYTIASFKHLSNDFFIISAGMDNAAATTPISMNEYDFLTQVQTSNPGIFSQIDGMASHSYPNPAFSQPPTYLSKTSIVSFLYEKNLLQGFANKDLPVFITETGWAQDVVGQDTAAHYLSTAFQTVWNTDSVVAITPFLLQAGSGPFTPFSFFDSSGKENTVYTTLHDLPKVKGTPHVNPEQVLSAQTISSSVPMERFRKIQQSNFPDQLEMGIKKIFKFFLHI